MHLMYLTATLIPCQLCGYTTQFGYCVLFYRPLAVMGDFAVWSTFYDDTESLPVMFRVNRQLTTNQLYSKVATEVDVDNEL